MRLSHKAKAAADALSGQLDQSVRKVAAKMAQDQGLEYADSQHVKEAFRLQILAIADEFRPPKPCHCSEMYPGEGKPTVKRVEPRQNVGGCDQCNNGPHLGPCLVD